jgi:flagellar hook-associated protein 3 FlgL
MRITQKMMSNIFVNNLRNQTRGILERQEQISNQKRINRPSDDPAGMARVLRGRSALAAVDQYSGNIKQTKSRVEFTEEILKLADDLVQRARRTAEENSGDSVTSEQRALAAEGIKETYDQLMQIANSRFGDRYIFGGHQTLAPPFSRDDQFAIDYAGDDGNYRVPIAEGVEIALDADGENFFQDELGGGVDIFDELQGLIDGLEHPDFDTGSAMIQAAIDPLEDAHAQLMDKRSEFAPKLYRLEATESHWKNYKAIVANAIGREEDVDMAQAIIELKNLETSYEATLATASRIIQQSLVNFLK